MDLKKLLENAGITENVDAVEESILKEIGKNFVPKTQYSKKVQALDEANEKNAEYEAKFEKYEKEYKNGSSELETLRQEYEEFKVKVENDKKRSEKQAILNNLLQNDGFNSKIIKLVSKEFDIDNLEVEQGTIKGWEELSKNVKEEYKEFISKDKVYGNAGMTPPNSQGGSEVPKSLGEALHQKYNL